jgi:hypothetical protein
MHGSSKNSAESAFDRIDDFSNDFSAWGDLLSTGPDHSVVMPLNINDRSTTLVRIYNC